MRADRDASVAPHVNPRGPDMAMYESDHTKFMREWMRSTRTSATSRRRAVPCGGTSRRASRKRVAAARVPVKPYYYDINN